MAKAPVAVVVAPFWASVTGTTTSLLRPLMLSLPATSNWLAFTRLMLLDWNVAWGNAATLNQVALGSSALASRLMSALPVSTVKAILLVASWAGSNATWALKRLKRPSTGTPIWRLTNTMSLCAGSSVCWAWAASGSSGSNETAAKEKDHKRAFIQQFLHQEIKKSISGGQRPCAATNRRGPAAGA
jgi:hypothetical protein